ncbi:rod shape-determining protein RodA [bacterium]|nr:rod shape-determining protein RodA [bacterium]MCB1220540.1 rod shape-determining protein RodA [bacterium]UNM09076.1 MAG: rod shape-determining protein RodA [Planctomycetales bacterium]
MRSLSFDWVLFLLGLALSISGLVYVYSATWEAGDTPGVFFSIVEIKQIVWLVIALVVHHFVRRVNWGLRPESWLWFYVPVAAALVLVLLIGASHGMGANRWISIGPVDIQPSEFAKLAFILILAWLFSREGLRADRAYLTALGVLMSLLALVLLQPDLGTAMVFVAVFFVMALFTPVRRRLILATLVGFVLMGIFAWQFLFYPHQKDRIRAFLDPKADPQGIGYQINQSEIAVGSGGLTGKGFLRGTQTRGGFIPVIESDFIFALIAEEYGFLGCLYVLTMYFFLIARILAISRDVQSNYERYICYGASAFFFFHVFVAAGMTIRLTPVTGLPLPFISQGGSSLMTMWLVLAIIQSLYFNSRRDFRALRMRR